MSEELVDLSEFSCGELSPETSQPCVLRASNDAHQAGHESAYIDNVRAVWTTTGNEWWRKVAEDGQRRSPAPPIGGRANQGDGVNHSADRRHTAGGPLDMNKGQIALWLILLVVVSGGVGARLASGSWPWQAVLAGLLFAAVVSQIGYELRGSKRGGDR